MKNILLILSLILGSKSLSSQSINKITHNLSSDDTIIIEQLKAIELNNFVGSSFSNFLKNDTLSKFLEYDLELINPKVLGGVYLFYSDNIVVIVYFDEIKFQNYLEPPENWSFELLKNERISEIKLVFKNKKIKSTREP